MSRDDDTIEIDMSKILGNTPSNVVRVDFEKKSEPLKTAAAAPPFAIRWLGRFDAESPWFMRILAALVVLLLSLLMV